MDGGGGAASPDDAAICISPRVGPIVAVAPAGIRVDNCYVFKSRLQQYTLKLGIPTPEYHTLKEGPAHEPVFKSTVVVNNARYESLPGFFNQKAAEQSAAEVALMELAMSAPLTDKRIIRAVQETGLCKNLLQEYAQKMNYAIPSYICTKQGAGAAPYICSVEIGGILYIGASATKKKDAEIKAARTALLAIQGQSEGGANGVKNYSVVPGQRPVKEADKKPIETPKPLKVKKPPNHFLLFRRKWNERKFMGMADQVAEKDVEEGLGMLVQYDSEDSRRIECELPGDTAMVQFNEEVITMQPGEGDVILQLEPPRDPAVVEHNMEATSDEQDPLSNAEAVKPNNEAVTTEHDSVSTNVASRSNGDSTDVKEVIMMQPGEGDMILQLGPPRDPAEVQHNKEARSVEQDPPSNTEEVKPNNEATTIEYESVSACVALRSNGDSTDVF